jgi:threonine/homoserine/homoserine lactone efflux protein
MMFWSFVLACILIELTPGPNMTWLAALGANKGRTTAFAAVLGICLGLSIAAIVAGLGLTALLNQFPVLFHGLRWAGALYLLYLAYDAWHDSTDAQAQSTDTSRAAFTQGLITNMLNPKAYLFYAAMLPQFASTPTPAMAELALLSVTYVAIATVIHAAIALLAGTAAVFLQSSPHAITIRKGLAVLIAIAAVWFFYSTRIKT